jgi:hypothetical protein
MIVGYNHNVSYRGVGFHVQTEDSGPKKPQLVTLLYHGGTIIASQKTSYADIIKVDKLEQVVEDLAKEQHKGMLKKLTRGEFDGRIIELGIPLGAAAEKAEEAAAAASQISAATADLLDAESAAGVEIVEEPVVDKFRKPQAPQTSLDELILAYLTAGRKSA